MWAVAVYDLHISTEYFWRLTPYAYFKLYDRFLAAQETEDYRTAHIVCTLANIHRPKDSKAFKVEDFLPNRRSKKKEEKRQTVAEQMEIAKAITLAYGGKVVDKLKKVPKS